MAWCGRPTSYLLLICTVDIITHLRISHSIFLWSVGRWQSWHDISNFICIYPEVNKIMSFSYERYFSVFCMKVLIKKKKIRMLIIIQWTQYKDDTCPSVHTLYLCFDGWRVCILRHKEHNCYFRNYGQVIVNLIAGRYFHNWFIFIFLVIHTLNFRMICWSILFLFRRNLIPNLSLD